MIIGLSSGLRKALMRYRNDTTFVINDIILYNIM